MGLSIRQIKTTMFSTPSNYKNSREYYSNNLQDKINDTWEWSSDTFEAEMETSRGSNVFAPIVCRINHAISPITGLNRGEDFKKLIFFDLNESRHVGDKFRFNNNTWLCVNTDEYEYATKQSIVRRCNNVIKFIDPKQGNVLSEECVIEYSMKYSTPYFNNVIDIPQGTIVVICQNNFDTAKLRLNDRIIFDTQTFKIKSINNFLREYTSDEGSAQLITFECYIDDIAPDDNFNTGIANEDNSSPNYPPIPQPTYPTTLVFPQHDTILQNRSQDFSIYYYDEDGNKTDKQFEFYPAWINTDYYIFKPLDGNNFRITNNHRLDNHKIKIKCVSGEIEYMFEIALGGLY